MFDVFTDEIEFLIKEGISNLYWYKGDLEKCLIRAGVDARTAREIRNRTNTDGQPITKRQIMDDLYIEFRGREKNRRIEVSRNLARTLMEHKNFVSENSGHKIDIAERCSLKLQKIAQEQRLEQKKKEAARIAKSNQAEEDIFTSREKIRARFYAAMSLEPQARGYELEQIVYELARAHHLRATQPYEIDGEQMDGTIHFDGHTYLVECKWTNSKSNRSDIDPLYSKALGKLGGLGILVSMNGYTEEAVRSLPSGKEIRVILLDGKHLIGVIDGIYSLTVLLEHALHAASAKAVVYSDYDIL